MFRALAALALVLATGCNTLAIDPVGVTAAEAGDYTLVQTTPGTVFGQGGNIYRFALNGPVAEKWTLITPAGKPILGGELRVRYGGRVIPGVINPDSPIQEIAWKDIVGADKWTTDLSGPVQVTATLKYQGLNGPEWVDYLGIAFIVVLPEGYSPLPFNSPNAAFQTKCTMQYTTAGRSALECK